MNFQLDHIYKSYVEKCENRDVSMWTNVNEVGSKMLYTHINQMHGLVSTMYKVRELEI